MRRCIAPIVDKYTSERLMAQPGSMSRSPQRLGQSGEGKRTARKMYRTGDAAKADVFHYITSAIRNADTRRSDISEPVEFEKPSTITYDAINRIGSFESKFAVLGRYPFANAHTAACVRLATRIFRRIDFMWTFTVASVRARSRAIALLQ